MRCSGFLFGRERSLFGAAAFPVRRAGKAA
jgi:hypothetical protein